MDILRLIGYSITLLAAALIASTLIATLRKHGSLLSRGFVYLFLAAAFQNAVLAAAVMIILGGGFGSPLHQLVIDFLAVPTLTMAAAMVYLAWIIRWRSRKP